MKKFLSVLLVAVLIGSTALFPAAAEMDSVQNEQSNASATATQTSTSTVEGPIDIGEGLQPTITPLSTGDQTLYHICFVSDGHMLTSPGSSGTPYTNQYIENNTSMQWIFEEYYGEYLIRSAANPNYVLTVEAGSGAVSVKQYGTGGYQYWVIYGSGDATYLLIDRDFNYVGENYLYSSGDYPFTLSMSDSFSDKTAIRLIPPNQLWKHTSMTVDNVYLIANATRTIEAPTYSGDSPASYVTNPWLLYSSADTSVCTVDSLGTVTAVNYGTTTITVTNKISRISTTCSAYVVTPVNLGAKIIYAFNSSASINSDVSAYYSLYNTAVADFSSTFNINFSIVSSGAVAGLDEAYECPHGLTTHCDSTCGALTSCATRHHKSASGLLAVESNQSGSGGSPLYVIRFAEHVMCRYNGQDHISVSGVAYRYGTDCIVSIVNSNEAIQTIQHELSHNLGTSDDACSSITCAMNGAIGKWCNNCYNAIMANRVSLD